MKCRYQRSNITTSASRLNAHHAESGAVKRADTDAEVSSTRGGHAPSGWLSRHSVCAREREREAVRGGMEGVATSVQQQHSPPDVRRVIRCGQGQGAERHAHKNRYPEHHFSWGLGVGGRLGRASLAYERVQDRVQLSHDGQAATRATSQFTSPRALATPGCWVVRSLQLIRELDATPATLRELGTRTSAGATGGFGKTWQLTEKTSSRTWQSCG